MKTSRLLKKISTFIVAIAMAIVMVLPAMAAEGDVNQSITTANLTIKEADNTDGVGTYTAYPVISWTVAISGNELIYGSMEVQDDFKQIITDEKLEEIKGMASSSEVTSDIAGVAAELLAAAKANNVTGIVSANGQFKDLPIGYYLVEETDVPENSSRVSSRPILVAVPNGISNNEINTDTTVHVKTSTPTVEKKIVEDGALKDANSAAIGDIIHYQVTSTIPVYGANYSNDMIKYYYKDKLSQGLTWNNEHPVVKLVSSDGKNSITLKDDIDYTHDNPTGVEGAEVKIDLSGTFGNRVGDEGKTIRDYANENYKLQVTYSAVLNENANIGSNGNPNEVTLYYSNDPTTGEGSASDVVITYSVGVIIDKVDGDDRNIKLSGATFTITKPGESDPFMTGTSDENGIVIFKGLAPGTYIIAETQAPAGYTRYEGTLTVEIKEPVYATNITAGTEKVAWDRITVTSSEGNPYDVIADATIDGHEGNYKTEVVNSKGFALPSTGGIGTGIFTTIGIGLIICGVVVLSVKMCKNKKRA